MTVDHAGVDHALADGGGDMQTKMNRARKLKLSRPDNGLTRLQYASRHDSGDRIGGIVEAVHEVERERERNEQHDDP